MRNSRYRSLSKIDYRNAYSELELFCKKNTELVMFGEFGNVSFPGISDLDVFICLDDSNYSFDRNNIIKFIEQDEIRKYLFFHDPLIIPESILPYLKTFHTCYNLDFTFSLKDKIVDNVSKKHNELLSNIWTTFLMSIGPKILLQENFEIRDYLLVHKNICQSIQNIDSQSRALELSKEVRDEFFRKKKNKLWVKNVFKRELDHLYAISNNIFNSNSSIIKTEKQIRLGWKKYFYQSEQNNYRIEGDTVLIYLNEGLFNFLNQFYHRKTNNSSVKNYIIKSIKVSHICNQYGAPYPFICPFAYNFYRNDLKFYLKKKLLSL